MKQETPLHRAFAVDAQGNRSPIAAAKLVLDLGDGVDVEINLAAGHGRSFHVQVPVKVDPATGQIKEYSSLVLMPGACNSVTILVKTAPYAPVSQHGAT